MKKVLPPALVVLKGSLSLVPELQIAAATGVHPFHTVRLSRGGNAFRFVGEIQARAASQSYRTLVFGAGNEANLCDRNSTLSLSIATLESPEIRKRDNHDDLCG